MAAGTSKELSQMLLGKTWEGQVVISAAAWAFLRCYCDELPDAN